MKKVSPAHRQANSGIRRVEQLVAGIGWIFRPTPRDDYGIDGEIEVVTNGIAMNCLLKVQVKSGRSYLRNETDAGFAVLVSEQDLDYWVGCNLPVVLLIHDPRNDAVYWKWIHGETESSRGSRTLLRFRKEQNLLLESSAIELRKIADRSKPDRRPEAAIALEKLFPLLEAKSRATRSVLDDDFLLQLYRQRHHVSLSETQRDLVLVSLLSARSGVGWYFFRCDDRYTIMNRLARTIAGPYERCTNIPAMHFLRKIVQSSDVEILYQVVRVANGAKTGVDIAEMLSHVLKPEHLELGRSGISIGSESTQCFGLHVLSKVGTSADIGLAIPLLKHQNRLVVRDAALAIAALAGPLELDLAIAFLRYPELDVRRAGAQAVIRIADASALGKIAAAVPDWNLDGPFEEADDDTDPPIDEGEESSNVLATILKKALLEQVIEIGSMGNFRVNKVAAHEISSRNYDGIESQLAALSNHPYGWVRGAVSALLFRDDSCFDSLQIRAAVRDLNRDVRLNAAKALLHIASDDDRPVFVEMLSDSDRDISGIGLEALEFLGTGKEVPAIKALLQRTPSTMAACVLARLSGIESVKELRASRDVDLGTVYAEYGTVADLPVILKALSDRNPSMEWRKALSNVIGPSDLPELERLILHDDRGEEYAFAALVKLAKISRAEIKTAIRSSAEPRVCRAMARAFIVGASGSELSELLKLDWFGENEAVMALVPALVYHVSTSLDLVRHVLSHFSDYRLRPLSAVFSKFATAGDWNLLWRLSKGPAAVPELGEALTRLCKPEHIGDIRSRVGPSDRGVNQLAERLLLNLMGDDVELVLSMIDAPSEYERWVALHAIIGHIRAIDHLAIDRLLRSRWKDVRCEMARIVFSRITGYGADYDLSDCEADVICVYDTMVFGIDTLVERFAGIRNSSDRRTS